MPIGSGSFDASLIKFHIIIQDKFEEVLEDVRVVLTMFFQSALISYCMVLFSKETAQRISLK